MFDLFKLCHFTKKTQGFTPNVELAIDELEAQLAAPPAKGEDPKSTTDVVSGVLDDNTKKNMFLQNVGIQTMRPKSILQNVKAQLEVQKTTNIQLHRKVDDLERKAQETEQERLRDKEKMKKKYGELEAKCELMLGQH
ncbi:unnamed protein product [Urochloa humidicola]